MIDERESKRAAAAAYLYLTNVEDQLVSSYMRIRGRIGDNVGAAILAVAATVCLELHEHEQPDEER